MLVAATCYVPCTLFIHSIFLSPIQLIMKKLLLLSAMALSMGYAQSQNTASPTSGIQFGIKAGVNAATTSDGFGAGTLFKDPNYKVGLVLGGFLKMPIGKTFTLQPELIYSAEGSVQDGKYGSVSDNNYAQIFNVTLNYLQLPVMLQYNSKGGFYLEAGPQFGLLLKAEREYKFPGTPSVTTDLKDLSKGFAFGFGGGIGYNTKSGFGFGARYMARLSDALDINVSGTSLKGSAISLGIHYQFGN